MFIGKLRQKYFWLKQLLCKTFGQFLFRFVFIKIVVLPNRFETASDGMVLILLKLHVVVTPLLDILQCKLYGGSSLNKKQPGCGT